MAKSGRKLNDDDDDISSTPPSSLRRSSRETPSKKDTPPPPSTATVSPSTTRKSLRIENRTPPPTPISSTGKKRLDARTYRQSLLKSQAASKRKLHSISNSLEEPIPENSPKRIKTCDKLDSHVSHKEANQSIFPTSPPSNSKQTSSHHCSDTQRLEIVPEKFIMNSCNNGNDHDSHNRSFLEDGGEFTTRACLGSSEECCDDVETKYDNNTCVICNLGGKLLHCGGKGCNRNYHGYCLDPPLKSSPLGVWHCYQCIKKKIQFGVYSVSEGIEFICDVREEGLPDCEEIQKQYLVKYKGLAHAHNHWIPEDQLYHEVPSLVAEFKKNQAQWKPEWMRPQRLVQKRTLMSPNQGSGSFGDCQYEWYVKWSGLGYEHATWELENAPFLKSPEAIPLIKDYESRLENAIRASDLSIRKSLEERKVSSFKVSKLPTRNMAGIDNDHLKFVNKLREYWHKNENVIVEDQERILKVALFILSLQSDVCRPFLIISTSYGISAWEAEFMRVAPSVNFVVYNGNKEVRESIRSLEFFADGDCIKVQVLLSTVEAVIEDLEALELIQWEALIVDDCQQPRVSKHFEEVKRLPSGFRILLLSGSIKESIAEYCNILSFVNSKDDGHADVVMEVDSGNSNTITKLKEKLARLVVCERKVDPSKFVEYWVPVQLSNVQLEQYCATLLSSSDLLRSSSRNDPVGALRDILISVRKCCDHPYIVDQSLQNLLTEDVPDTEILDVGVNASGKLQFLDKILPEIKRSGLRVLIVFQSIGGSGLNNIGDILDDFLRQRFGPDSYERVDSGLVNSKKQAALNMFNNKERGRFVFMIEKRACLPSIKLSSVDMVILFDSDWNPLYDLRALQKITIDSQFEQLKVFRLYSTFTVEEKVLALAKQDMILDSNIQTISRGTSHTLLLWGARFLFYRLDEFHSGSTPCTGSNLELNFLNDVVQDFVSQLPTASEVAVMNCKIILKAQHVGASYSKDIVLVGEKDMQLIDEELPHISWMNLLEGRSPRWRCTSGPSLRVRRKVQYFDDSPKKSSDKDEASKKRKKSCNDTDGSNMLKARTDNKKQSVSTDKEDASHTLTFDGSQNLLVSTVNADSANHPVSDNLSDSQMNLHTSLKPVISNLCEILQLPDDVTSMAAKFLDYVINNFKVTREPVTIFQAFQISLCWSAASLLGHKFSYKDSLLLAKKHLNFECKEEETQLLYSVMRPQRQNFRNQLKCSESISAETCSPRDKHSHHVRASEATLDVQQQSTEGEMRESSVQSGVSKLKKTDELESIKNESSQSVEHVKKLHSQRMKKIYQKQMEEFEKFNEYREKEKADMEMKHQLESVIVGKIHSQSSVRFEKQKKIDEEFKKKKEELKIQMDAKQEKLQSMQRQARDKEKQMSSDWLEEAKLGRSVAAYATLPLCSSGFRVENVAELGEAVISHENNEQGGGEVEKLRTDSLEKQDGEGDGVEAEVASVENCGLDASVSTVPELLDERSTVLKTCVSLSATADILNSNSGSPTLNQDEAISPRECAGPSVAVAGGELQNLSQMQQLEATCTVVGHEQDTGPLEPQQDGDGVEAEVVAVENCGLDASVSTVPQLPDERSTVLKTCVSLSAAADIFDSNSGPPALNQDQAISPRECAGPSVAVAGCEVQNLSQMQQLEATCTVVGHEQGTGPLEPQQDPVPVEQQKLIPHQSQVPATVVASQPTISASVGACQVPVPSIDSLVEERQSAQIQLPPEDPVVDYQLRNSLSQVARQPAAAAAAEQIVGWNSSSVSRTQIPVLQQPSRLPIPARPPPQQRAFSDPLENELIRIKREEEHVMKTHEEEKVKLNSECKKEIEEIQKKYNSMLQEVELELGQKKKALETNYNIVYMNKILADAFRMKCDARNSAGLLPQPQQQHQPQPPPYVLQQPQQQPQLQQPPHALQQPPHTLQQPPHALQQPPHTLQQPPHALQQPQQKAWPSISSQRPAVQTVVHQPSALFSNNQRSHFHHPPKTVTEMRSPAPHLQPFRPVGALMRGPQPHPQPQPQPQPAMVERMTQVVRGNSSSSTVVCLSDDD